MSCYRYDWFAYRLVDRHRLINKIQKNISESTNFYSVVVIQRYCPDI